MLDDPTIRGTELPPALPAAPMPFQKELGDLLLCQADARIVVPGGSHGPYLLRSFSRYSARQSSLAAMAKSAPAKADANVSVPFTVT